MAIEELAELVTGLTTANLKHGQADFINKLAELRIERAEFITEIQKLKEQVKLLQDEKEKPLVYKDGLYYSTDDTDNKCPYCSACYESSKKRIHLVKQKCPICNTDYFVPSGPSIFVRKHRSSILDGY
jgi:hypothetical protein